MFSLVLGAVDVSQIIGVCVLVISVLSWFVNAIQGKTPDGVPRAKPPKPKSQSGRSEIEVLLQQLSGEKPKPELRERPKPPRPQPPSDRGRSKSKLPAQRRDAASGSSASRPMPRVAESHLASSNVGSGVRSHQMGNRVDATVERDITGAVQQDIQTTVQHDLGNRIAAALPVQEKSIHPLVKILRDPNGVRQAILLNEILQRPKARRG